MGIDMEIGMGLEQGRERDWRQIDIKYFTNNIFFTIYFKL
jgi:hypothetical protein